MSGKKLIALVDDDDAVCKSIGRLLRVAGMECLSYESGNAFLDPTRFRIPDCMVLDVAMPGIDGFALLQRLTNQGFTFPVIILSAHNDRSNRQRACFAGAVQFVGKPFNDYELLHAIEDALKPSAPAGNDCAGAATPP